jgi:hypothetical protein
MTTICSNRAGMLATFLEPTATPSQYVLPLEVRKWSLQVLSLEQVLRNCPKSFLHLLHLPYQVVTELCFSTAFILPRATVIVSY